VVPASRRYDVKARSLQGAGAKIESGMKIDELGGGN
jgi:hypothetical protein